MPAPPYAESSSENGRQKTDVAKKANRHLPETARQALLFLHLSITGFIPVFPEKTCLSGLYTSSSGKYFHQKNPVPVFRHPPKIHSIPFPESIKIR